MKPIYLIILGLSIQSFLFAQSTAELDQKGGFKEFKIGDDISVYKDKAKFTKTLENADTKMFLVKDRVSVKTYTGRDRIEIIQREGPGRDRKL
ncbi:MAG: hypothetical protein WDN75_08820 [Bacteroidota bacterium]